MKILLIEDEVKMAQALSKGLTMQGIEVDIAHDAMQAKGLMDSNTYEVIVSDIIMPGKTGLELLKEIRQAGVQTPVLLLTALGQIEEKELGFELGADDYLTKPFEFRELSMRIKALARRAQALQTPEPEVIKYADLELHIGTKEVFREGQQINLTPREFELLWYFMNNPGRVISKQEIVQKVWNLHFDTGTNLVEVYLNFLRKKVEKGFQKKLIHTVVRSGYMLRAEKTS
jgi:two-component system, OmpR family, copper resistance phosphate regulon response regulator CusR